MCALRPLETTDLSGRRSIRRGNPGCPRRIAPPSSTRGPKGGFVHDRLALQMADVTVLVLPCERSAHLERGYAAGVGQRTAVLMLEPCEAELMYLLVDRLCQIYG